MTTYANEIVPSDTEALPFPYGTILSRTHGLVSLETPEHGRIQIQMEAGRVYTITYTAVYTTGTTATGLRVAKNCCSSRPSQRDAILLEDGSYLLSEDGYTLLL